MNIERIKYWLSVGAKASDTMHNMLVTVGVIQGKKINILPAYKEPAKEESKPAAESSGEAKKEEAATPAEAPAEVSVEAPAGEASAPVETVEAKQA